MRPTAGPALLRATVPIAAVVLMATPERPNAIASVIAGIGVLGALAWPDRIGAGTVTAGFVLAWMSASGWHGEPSLVRTVIAAAALYVLHTATALAAVTPLTARVAPAVLLAVGRRSLLVAAVATAVIAADYALAERRGSPLLEVIGLLAALGLAAVPLRRALR